MKIDYSFHSHTYRCGHASGDVFDYVPLAIENGYKIYGLSDHVLLPGVIQKWTRGEYSQLDDYIEEYQKTKEKFKDKIQMYLGFECEYSDVFVDYYKYLLKEKGFDYLICGQHCGFDNNKNPYSYFNSHEGIIKYKQDIIKAMESGLFLYIAHPDMFFLTAEEVTPFHKKITKEIIRAAIKNDAVLEINIHGLLREHLRNGHIYIDYPCDYFWKEVAKTNIKVVLGGDFHNPNEIGNAKTKMLLDDLFKKCQVRISNIENIYYKYIKRIKSNF